MKVDNVVKKRFSDKVVVKKCHMCGQIMESTKEIMRCIKCSKSFLPHNYFGKVHAKNSTDFEKLFSSAVDLHDDDLIKGITVLW
jgi:hypothetical protein